MGNKRGEAQLSRRALLAGSAAVVCGSTVGAALPARQGNRLQPQFRRVMLDK